VEYVARRLEQRNHCVVVIAEGAGQSVFGHTMVKDASGNTQFVDVGVALKKVLQKELSQITLKYIDPSYVIRAAPASPFDEEFCVLLAQMAVHAAMTGKTNVCVGFLSGQFALIPLEKLKGRKHVDLNGMLYSTMVASIGQPACLSKKPQSKSK
jgi:6-phosphofructokinase 1